MVKVFLIFECVPEDIDFYLLDVDSEILAKLKACNGHVVNQGSDDEWPEDWLSEWSQTIEQFRVKTPFTLPEGVIVINTGFYL